MDLLRWQIERSLGFRQPVHRKYLDPRQPASKFLDVCRGEGGRGVGHIPQTGEIEPLQVSAQQNGEHARNAGKAGNTLFCDTFQKHCRIRERAFEHQRPAERERHNRLVQAIAVRKRQDIQDNVRLGIFQINDHRI